MFTLGQTVEQVEAEPRRRAGGPACDATACRCVEGRADAQKLVMSGRQLVEWFVLADDGRRSGS